MRSVGLLRLQLENFRSFKHLDMSLDPGPGLHLLTGRNDESPRLGANGAGKSSLWDGVLFALWGRSARGLRGGDLVRQGATGLVATLELAVGGTRHTLRRSAPPERILLDGERVEQWQIDTLLGRSAAAFTQSVIFGQGRPLFLDLGIPERSALLDEVLDLEVWLKHSATAGEEAQRLQRMETSLERDIASTEGRLLAHTASLEQLREMAAQWQEQHDAEIERLLAQGEELEGQVAAALAELEATPVPMFGTTDYLKWDIEKHTVEINRLEQEAAIAARGAKQARARVEFYKTTDVCDECQAPITSAHRAERLAFYQEAESKAFVTVAQATNSVQRLKQLRAQAVAEQAEDLKQEAAEKEAHRAALSHWTFVDYKLKDVTDRLEQLTQQTANPNLAAIEQAQEQVGQAQALLAELRIQLADVQRDRAAAEFWKAGFKRLRMYLAGQVLGVLELDVGNAASSLGLADWRIGFSHQKETKSDTVKLGVHVTITTPSGRVSPYEAWSGGEAQRIRLASALGMASMIERLTATCFSFEVYDEPTSWLSQEGVEDLLSCLEARAAAKGIAIWVLDHRSLQSSSFTSVTTIVKNAEGESHVEH